MLLGLVNALGFDLFSAALGMELKPILPRVEARLIVWMFFVLDGKILAKAAAMTLANVWTACLVVLVPHISTRVARGEASTKTQRLLRALTTL